MQNLYLIECHGYVKIGVAYNVERRLVDLSIGNPFELKILAAYAFNNAQVVEQALHQRFEPSLVRGEWFSFTEQDILDFHILCQNLGGVLSTVENEMSEADEELAKEQKRIDEGLAQINYLKQKKIEKDIKNTQRDAEIWERYSKLDQNLAQIQREVFGDTITGGANFHKIKNVIARFELNNDK